MEQNEKGHAPKDTTPKEPCKGSQSGKTICRVWQLLAAGGKYSARQINSQCNTNDARKSISVLIHTYNQPIGKEWHEDGYKLFWLNASSPAAPEKGGVQ